MRWPRPVLRPNRPGSTSEGWQAFSPVAVYPTLARALTKASTQRRTSSSLWAADSCTRIRALPCGTTGYEKAMT